MRTSLTVLTALQRFRERLDTVCAELNGHSASLTCLRVPIQTETHVTMVKGKTMPSNHLRDTAPLGMQLALAIAVKTKDTELSVRVIKTLLVAVLALVLPVVAGCRSCEGGACAIVASETGKAFSTSEPAVVKTAALQALLTANAPLVLLDARSGKYDDGRRIPGARSLNDKSSAEEIAKVVKTKDTLIVTYCSNLQCQASPRLAKHLRGLGYKSVLEYSEGIAGWTEAGNRVKEAQK